MSRYDIAQANMVLGGIPYYMSYFAKGKSLAQNIDALFFSKGAKLRNEFSRLFASVFVKPEEMMKIVRFLSTRRSGYSREEIVEGTGLGNNGELSKRLDALATSDFIENYVPFGESKRNHRYKLIDPFCLFYLRFVDGQKSLNTQFWMNNVDSPKINSWRSYAFEDLCFRHIDKIKQALQIAGVETSQSAWSLHGDGKQDGVQIDMVISRKDNVVNVCEMKFYSEVFAVTEDYQKKLVQRANLITKMLPKKMTVQGVLVTTYGLAYNAYSGAFASTVTLDDLF